MKNIGIIVVVIIVIAGGAWLYSNQTSAPAPADTENDAMMDDGDHMDDDAMMDDGDSMAVPADGDAMVDEMVEDGDSMMDDEDNMMDAGEVKSFTLDSFKFGYDVTEIKVKEGDKIKITLTNSDGFHDWVVDEFNAATKQINKGETDTIEFIADKAGTYEFYCSVGNHREMGMVGTLIVE